MRKAWRYLFLKIFTDILIVNLAFICSFSAKFKTIDFISAIAIYYKSLFFITILWLVVLNLAGLYKLQLDKASRIDNYFSVSFGVFSAAFFTYVIAALRYGEAFYSRDVIIIASFIAFVLINISRQLIWVAYSRYK